MSIKSFVDNKNPFASILNKSQFIDILDEINFKKDFPFETIMEEIKEFEIIG